MDIYDITEVTEGSLPGRLPDSLREASGGRPMRGSVTPLYITRYSGPREIQPLRQHPFWELTYVLHRQWRVELENGGFNLDGESGLLLPPHYPHRECGGDPTWDTLWLAFRGDLPQRLKVVNPLFLSNGHGLGTWAEQIWLWGRREPGGPALNWMIWPFFSSRQYVNEDEFLMAL